MNPLNVGAVCTPCAQKRLKAGAFKGKDPQTFLGRCVKLAFPARNPETGREVQEHMWVIVTGLHEDGLQGTLDNDPVLICEYQHGDAVAFGVAEIEDVYAG